MKRITIVLLMLLVLLVVACTSPAQEEEQSIKESPELLMRYETFAKEADIDNFQIRVYFGWRAFLAYNEKYDNLDFDLIVEEWDPLFKSVVIRHIDNFESAEYAVHIVFDEKGNGCRYYEHSEIITLPKELFEANASTMKIRVSGSIDESYTPGGGYAFLKYEKINDEKIRIVYD